MEETARQRLSLGEFAPCAEEINTKFLSMMYLSGWNETETVIFSQAFLLQSLDFLQLLCVLVSHRF